MGGWVGSRGGKGGLGAAGWVFGGLGAEPSLPVHTSPCLPCLTCPSSSPCLPACRRRYKEETAKLSQQLKSASQGHKATDKQSDRLQKEIDKLRWGRAAPAGRCAVGAAAAVVAGRQAGMQV